MGKKQCLILIIGAGPAGLFAADTLSKEGHQVVLVNRDVKPGGLVEYGVFPTKHRFKRGLRKQFGKVLGRDNVHYRGTVRVGQGGHFTVEELAAMGFDAVLVAVGAQGTRWIGLPGERADGVYHAKDLVYHYNRLPPFSGDSFPFGDRVAIIGVGNVMVDVVHYLGRFRRTPELIALSRTVPRFRKWADKELKEVCDIVDVDGMVEEVDAVRDLLVEAGETPDEDLKVMLKYSLPEPWRSPPNWRVKWLVNPVEIAVDDAGQCKGVILQPLRPVPREEGGRPRVEPLGDPVLLEVDNVVFAVGDSVDPSLGLPVGSWGFKTAAEAGVTHPGAGYELVGPQDEPLGNWFGVGWAREPSSGLVGQARKDASQVAKHVLSFLTHQGECEDAQGRLAAFDDAVVERVGYLLDVEVLEALAAAEAERAAEDEDFEGKFVSNAEMLAVMGIDVG